MKFSTIFYSVPRFLCISIVILTLHLFSSSCQKENNTTSTTNELAQGLDQRGKTGNTINEVRLKLTVNDAAGNNITSDGLGDYVDGTQNASIYFSTSGNLQFSTASNNPRTPTARWLNANFGSPLSGSTPRGNEKSNFMASATGSGTNPTAIQNLAIGETKCITLWLSLGMTLSGGVLNFHGKNEDSNTTNTSYVYVTRLSTTQWLMAPIPPSGFTGCSTISNVGALRISSVWNGDYNMPFSFTLTAK